MLVVQHRTGIILSLENMAQRQTGHNGGWRTLRKLPDEERRELLGDHDGLAFVTAEQVELIELLTKKIRRFEKKGWEHLPLRPAYYMVQRQENFDLTRVFGGANETAVDLGLRGWLAPTGLMGRPPFPWLQDETTSVLRKLFRPHHESPRVECLFR